MTLSACGPPAVETFVAFAQPADADRERGRLLASQHQCGSCHQIPEVPAADGRVGPTLERFGRRSYIAGLQPNGPASLARWIEDPQHLRPGTTMPDMGVPPAAARDIAAFLLSLR
ncbi:MAG TPA: c-type cytochrome [Burkholderiaceae bacterium]|nr:c-type cytochrome [Burkholderiaceae bacterium]